VDRGLWVFKVQNSFNLALYFLEDLGHHEMEVAHIELEIEEHGECSKPVVLAGFGCRGEFFSQVG